MLGVKIVPVMCVYVQPPTKQINSAQLMFLFCSQEKKKKKKDILACQAILRSFKKADMYEDMKCVSLNEWITGHTATWTIVFQEHQITIRRTSWSPQCPMWVSRIFWWKRIKMGEGG